MSSADSLTFQLDDSLRLNKACSNVVLVGAIIAYVTPNIGSIKVYLRLHKLNLEVL